MRARKLKDLYGVAPLDADSVVVAEAGTGKLLRVDAAGQLSTLAEGFAKPYEVVTAKDGTVFVSELGNGRVAKVEKNGNILSVIDGLDKPKGLALRQDSLLVLDRGLKELRAVSLVTGQQQTLAFHLPVGDPPGCSRGPMDFSGGLAVGPDETIYIAADGEGSVLTLMTEK
jgi:DNA-binding beta-propeller fold protein YncE